MESQLLEFFKFFAIYFVELSFLFVIVSVLIAFLNNRYKSTFEKHLGKDSYLSYIKAILLGSLTPFCSCSTIPLLRALLKANVVFGVCIAYLLTCPLVNPIIVGMLFVAFGLKITLIYVAFLFVAIFILSTMIHMEYMFSKAKSFNQNINAWDVSKVKDMHSMFAVAESFNQPLDKWNTSSVKYMKEMFYRAKSFNQSLDSWNVKNVLDMRDIFGSSPLQNNPPKWYKE